MESSSAELRSNMSASNREDALQNSQNGYGLRGLDQSPLLGQTILRRLARTDNTPVRVTYPLNSEKFDPKMGSVSFRRETQNQSDRANMESVTKMDDPTLFTISRRDKAIVLSGVGRVVYSMGSFRGMILDLDFSTD